jgi:hypothetical protein
MVDRLEYVVNYGTAIIDQAVHGITALLLPVGRSLNLI